MRAACVSRETRGWTQAPIHGEWEETIIIAPCQPPRNRNAARHRSKFQANAREEELGAQGHHATPWDQTTTSPLRTQGGSLYLNDRKGAVSPRLPDHRRTAITDNTPHCIHPEKFPERTKSRIGPRKHCTQTQFDVSRETRTAPILRTPNGWAAFAATSDSQSGHKLLREAQFDVSRETCTAPTLGNQIGWAAPAATSESQSGRKLLRYAKQKAGLAPAKTSGKPIRQFGGHGPRRCNRHFLRPTKESGTTSASQNLHQRAAK